MYDKGNKRHVRQVYVNVYMCAATGTGAHPGVRVPRWMTHVGIADMGARSQGQMKL